MCTSIACSLYTTARHLSSILAEHFSSFRKPVARDRGLVLCLCNRNISKNEEFRIWCSRWCCWRNDTPTKTLLGTIALKALKLLTTIQTCGTQHSIWLPQQDLLKLYKRESSSGKYFYPGAFSSNASRVAVYFRTRVGQLQSSKMGHTGHQAADRSLNFETASKHVGFKSCCYKGYPACIINCCE